MPLPAILAALARVGAGLAARAGASGVARSLIAAARTTGPAAARRAAAAAASRGSAAATTAAAETTSAGLHVQPGNPLGLGRPVVLEDSKLTNAKSLFQAIHGQAPSPAAAAASASQAAPAQQVQAAASAAGQQAAAPAAAAAPPPSVPPSASQAAAPQPGATPPSNPRPQNLLDRAVDAFHRAKATYQQAQARFTPIAEQVANMTIDQRYARLQQGGKMPDLGAVARQFATPNPSREQFVQHGEAEEERARQEAIQQSRSGQVGQAAWSAGKSVLAGALARSSPIGAATMPVWMYGIVTGFERLGRTISESNRDLSKFNERIADSFARLDYAQLRSRQQMATATSGSATYLNDQLASLVRELQPMRETVTTFFNAAGSSLVTLARIGALIVKWHPIFIALHNTAIAAEKFMNGRKAEEAQKAAKDFLRDIRDGKFERPKGGKPGT